MDDDDGEAFSDEDYVVVGTPLENDYVSNGYRREVKNPSVARQLPSWKQEVTDSEGRRRFHGAFTGGFSAGYYNTVGSKEGWAPKAFTSSRGKRADGAEQHKTREEQIEDLLDEDERAERKRRRLESTSDYDTFASRAESEARELAKYESRNDQASVIPGGPLLLDTIIKPVSNSIGVRMLLALGWRRGKGIGKATEIVGPGVSERGEHDSAGGSGVGVCNTPIYIQNPKDDNFGLGYDPFKNASEFSRKRDRDKGERGGQSGKGKELAFSSAPGRQSGASEGFGFGVFDEDDELRVEDVYGDAKGDYNFEIMDEEAEEDRGKLLSIRNAEGRRGGKGGGSESSLHQLPSVEKRALLANAPFEAANETSLEGFEYGGTLENRGEQEEYQYKWFPPPQVPRDFEINRHHRMRRQLLSQAPDVKRAKQKEESGAPARSDPPKDAKVLKTIDSLAAFVAKNGDAFEALAKERNAFDSKFNFLFGGVGSAYYKWKLYLEREKSEKSKAKTAERRGEEKKKKKELDAAARSKLLKDDGEAFGISRRDYLSKKGVAKKSEEKPQIAKADQKKLQSELNSMFTSAEIQDSLPPQMAGLSYPNRTKGGLEGGAGLEGSKQEAEVETEKRKKEDLVPVRTQGLWQPDYLLCKRFGVKDPHQGKIIPNQAKEFRSDTLLLPETSRNLAASAPKYLGGSKGDRKEERKPVTTPESSTKIDEESKRLAGIFLDSLDVSGIAGKGGNSERENGEEESVKAQVEIQYVEKPLDLFKKIFSDSEEDESEEKSDVEEGPSMKPPKVLEGKASEENPNRKTRHEMPEVEEKKKNEADFLSRGATGTGQATGFDVSHTSDVLKRFKSSSSSGRTTRKKHRRHHRHHRESRSRGEGEGEGDEKEKESRRGRGKRESDRQRHHRRHHRRKRRDRDQS